MNDYKVPHRDIQFTLLELLNYEQHCRDIGKEEDASPDVVEAILDEAAKFCENVVAPLNRSGDIEGCQFVDGNVTTPKGFKEAYQQYVDAGWPSMSHPVDFGGQGLPSSLETVMSEMAGTANWSWAMYPGLSHGAMKTLSSHGTQEQKQNYLTKLI